MLAGKAHPEGYVQLARPRVPSMYCSLPAVPLGQARQLFLSDRRHALVSSLHAGAVHESQLTHRGPPRVAKPVGDLLALALHGVED